MAANTSATLIKEIVAKGWLQAPQATNGVGAARKKSLTARSSGEMELGELSGSLQVC
jgi:hypothetical protein